MFSRDGRYKMVVERRITAGNRVNGALAALMRRRNVSTNCTQCSGTNAVCYTIVKRGYWLQKKNEIKWHSVENPSLRKICEVNSADRIRNEDIHRMAGNSEEEEHAQPVWAGRTKKWWKNYKKDLWWKNVKKCN